MNAIDLMRVLIDQLEAAPNQNGQMSPLGSAPHEEPNHDKQIADLLPSSCDKEYANEPDEQYADIDAVTVNAGGGMNGPKHPHDIRVKDPSAYPDAQEQTGLEKQPKQGLHSILINMMRDL